VQRSDLTFDIGFGIVLELGIVLVQAGGGSGRGREVTSLKY